MIYINTVYLIFAIVHCIKTQSPPSSEDDIKTKPNIILILADDMGFNDVSFRGSNQFLTPNIDSLAYHGMILNNYYVPALCTPSRSALLTGKYPINTGMQHYVIPNYEPWGLPLTEKLMPEIFRDAGYSTNLVGKWHLGFFQKEYTPIFRGFDYHFGYYGGYIGYYDHTLFNLNKPWGRGYDFRKNLDMTSEGNGSYATDVFTEEAVKIISMHNNAKPLFLMMSHLAPHAGNVDNPLEAPEDEIIKFKHIKNPDRRTYAAMVSKLDESVGKIVQALSDTGMLSNSIIIFYSDNGAPVAGIHSNSGSNKPLKGQKDSPWEGGLRTPAVIYSPLLRNMNQVFNQTIYVADWLPTLADAAQINAGLSNLDGINFWDQLVRGVGNKDRNIVHNIDEIIGYSSYSRGSWKYIKGTTQNGNYDSWFDMEDSATDPRALNYAEIIKGSLVGKVLENSVLTTKKIEELRKIATLKCPEDKDVHVGRKYQCIAGFQSCLFNIEEDPCEMVNLADDFPDILSSMKSDIENYRSKAKASARVMNDGDEEFDPKLHNFTWTWWKDISSHSSKALNFCKVLYILLTGFIQLVLIILT